MPNPEAASSLPAESEVQHRDTLDAAPSTESEERVLARVDAAVANTRVDAETRLVTAALPYINNVPHLGHIAGSHLPADIFARFCRLQGHDTLLIGGSDEYGTPSEIASKKIGVDFKRFCDTLHAEHKRVYEWFKISYDNYSRTSSEKHHEMTKDFFEMIKENGYVSEDVMEMYYDPVEERFLADRYVLGKCPKCDSEANADQCESCSYVLTAGELVDPRSQLSGAAPDLRETKHLFINLDELSDQLKEWIEENTHWNPHVRNFALGWIKEGLKKRSITRDLENGIPVSMEGYEDKVFYVWFEAPIGYVSGTAEAVPQEWQKYWRSQYGKIYHFLGKDNIPFHTIFWPGMIMAEGKTNLPHQVAGYQYLNYEGEKFSKSKGVGVFCNTLADSDMQSDLMRAYLSNVLPDKADTEFNWHDFHRRINNELIGKYGNFVHRSLSFIHSKLSGTTSRPSDDEFTDKEAALIEAMSEKIESIQKCMEGIEFRKAYSELMELAEAGNKYFNDTEPWKLVKTDIDRAKKVLYMCALTAKNLAILASPFLPDSSQKIWESLGLEGKVDQHGNWDALAASDLPDTFSVSSKPEPLFRKLSDEDIDQYRTELSATKDLEDYFRE